MDLTTVGVIPNPNSKLIVFTCSRASEDRTIPLSVIADRTKLSIEDVEHLLMKSLSVSSIKF